MQSRRIAGGILLAALIAGIILVPARSEAASGFCEFYKKYCPRLYELYCR